MKRSVLGVLLAAFVAASPLAQAASGFGVAPIRLELSGKAPRASFTLTNAGDVPIVVQAQPLAWSQAGGRDAYEDTDAIVVNPPIARIEPGRSQVVRIALRTPPDDVRETAYRMMFTEVPQPDAAAERPSAGTLTVVRRMDVPVYVAPAAGVPAPRGQVAARVDGDVLKLEFSNDGTGHWRLADLEVEGLDTHKTAQLPQFLVVLPGSKRVVEIPAVQETRASALRVRAEWAGGRFDERVPLQRAER